MKIIDIFLKIRDLTKAKKLADVYPIFSMFYVDNNNGKLLFIITNENIDQLKQLALSNEISWVGNRMVYALQKEII